MERIRGVLGGIISTGGALVSSLCCVLPLAIVFLGLGSGAFMATTMRYTPIFVPLGVLSVTTGFYLHFRERKRCARERCAMAGGAVNLILLIVSAVVVAAAVFFTLFPATSSDLLMWATSRHGAATPHTMDMPTGSSRWEETAAMYRRAFLGMFPGLWVALRAVAAGTGELVTAHLRIDGMTWGGWPPLVKRALEGLKGVRNVEVSFERAEAIVTYEKAAVSVEQMNQAVARYGFTATLKTAKP